jgi:hypothetical protein
MVTFAQGVPDRSAENVPLTGAARYFPSGGFFVEALPVPYFRGIKSSVIMRARRS